MTLEAERDARSRHDGMMKVTFLFVYFHKPQNSIQWDITLRSENLVIKIRRRVKGLTRL